MRSMGISTVSSFNICHGVGAQLPMIPLKVPPQPELMTPGAENRKCRSVFLGQFRGCYTPNLQFLEGK